MAELLPQIAKKLCEEPKIFKKTLEKAEVWTKSVDVACRIARQCSGSYAGPIFHVSLESSPAVPVVMPFKHRLYALTVPSFVHNIGERLLANTSITGLFRVPANGKRLEDAMRLIDAGQSLCDIAGLREHDVCGLLKEWTKKLPSPILCDYIADYLLHTFEKLVEERISKEDARQILVFLGDYVPQRYKHTLAYLSYVLLTISQNSTTNGMTLLNLAICCPTLFTGSLSQRGLNGRKLHALMFMMEFFILNPHVFLPDENTASVKCSAETASSVTLTRSAPAPPIEFPPPPPNFSAEMPSGPLPLGHCRKNRCAQGDRAQPFKGLNNLAVDLKNKIRGGLNISCLKPGEEDAENVEAKSWLGGTPSFRATGDTPDGGNGLTKLPDGENIFALVTPPRDQFRSKRHSSTRVSVISRRSFEDADLHAGPSSLPYSPVTLDFEDVIDWLTPPLDSKSSQRAQSKSREPSLRTRSVEASTRPGNLSKELSEKLLPKSGQTRCRSP